jgi:hypothetical protein
MGTNRVAPKEYAVLDEVVTPLNAAPLVDID